MSYIILLSQKLSRKMSVAGPMDEEIAAVAATTDYISKDRAKGKGRRGKTVCPIPFLFHHDPLVLPSSSLLN